tara:strand:+ start:8274 stop:8420 length:147 start_codon:yes stop_codon:yes gene_type:complete
MATNKEKDTLVTVSLSTRDKLKVQAEKEGRTMKGLLEIIISAYIKKAK